MWSTVTALASFTLSLAGAVPPPVGTDGHIPPLQSEQSHSFVCERISASIQLRQDRERLLSDRSNLATAIRMTLLGIAVDGRPLAGDGLARAQARIGQTIRVAGVQAYCMDDKIQLWVLAVPLADWLAYLSQQGLPPPVGAD